MMRVSQIFQAVMPLTLCSLLVGQAHPTDDLRGYYTVNLTMAGNANFRVKRMDLPVIGVGQSSTGLDSPYYANLILSKAYGSILKDAAVEKVTAWVTTYSSQYYSSYYSAYLGAYYGQLLSGVLSGIGYVMLAKTFLEIASQDNVKSREYYVFIPTNSDYYFDFFFPGDIDYPSNIANINKCNEDGSQTLAFHFESTYGSNAHITKKISLSRGIHRVTVSVGSGSLYFHTAGTCDAARLDAPDYINWTEQGFPVTSQDFLLLPYLPEIGSEYTFTVNTQLPQKPQEIRDGSVTYTDIIPILPAFTPDRTNAYLRRDFYGEPTEEELAEIGIWPYLI